jgi:hypothetical protein
MYEFVDFSLKHPAVQAANPTVFASYCSDNYDETFADQKKKLETCNKMWYQMRHDPYQVGRH